MCLLGSRTLALLDKLYNFTNDGHFNCAQNVDLYLEHFYHQFTILMVKNKTRFYLPVQFQF